MGPGVIKPFITNITHLLHIYDYANTSSSQLQFSVSAVLSWKKLLWFWALLTRRLLFVDNLFSSTSLGQTCSSWEKPLANALRTFA